MSLRALLFDASVDDTAFLKAIAERYPEAALLLQPRTTTTEGDADHSKSLAAQVFPAEQLAAPGTDPIEFDRAATGLLALRWVLTGEQGKLTANHGGNPLSDQDFSALRSLTQLGTSTDADLDALCYFTLLNDLGKTKAFVDAYKAAGGNPFDDHDVIISKVLETNAELAPSLNNRLGWRQRQDILRGLETGYNVGHLVHAENAPADTQAFCSAVQGPGRLLYLLHAAYDIAGAQGHVSPNGALTLAGGFGSSAVQALRQLFGARDGGAAHQAFLDWRAEGLGLDSAAEDRQLITRVAAMTRQFGPGAAEAARRALAAVPADERRVIADELAVSGLEGRKALLLTHIPAILANAGQAEAERHASTALNGQLAGWSAVARTWRAVRDQLGQEGLQGNGSVRVNLFQLAREARNGAGALRSAGLSLEGEGGQFTLKVKALTPSERLPAFVHPHV